jgi:aryl-alcohol dehydrogenase-like predicted oxidoreductase
MRCLDAWRAAIGLTYDADRAAPAPAPMPTTPLARLPRPISRLVLGTAGLTSQPQADTLFDAFLAAGGTAFDTAHEYGDGLSDTLLGTWMQSRNIRDQVTVIGKGAHSPDCFPATVTRQLHESLERLRTDRLDIYFLHRDNPAVPVGEFVDVLNEHHRAGRIGLFGGSNWTLRRMDEANAYAARHGLQGFHVLSNQFSLADMLKPVWAGCLSASDAKSIAWLKRTGIALFAWSSQARGFFTDRAGRNITTDRDLVRCWYNRRNFARRDRAAELARQRGTTAAAVALAYNLAQDFPLFSLIGPLTPDELQGSLAALRTPLTAAEAAWLKG